MPKPFLCYNPLVPIRWAFAIGVWVLVVAVRAGAAQDPVPPPAPDAPKTTMTVPLYTDAQAESGKTLFEGTCLGGCHDRGSHKGLTFKLRWDGQPLSDLYTLILKTMPDDAPGTLTPKKSAELVAYLLKLNGMPSGKDELPQDDATLKKITIAVPPAK